MPLQFDKFLIAQIRLHGETGTSKTPMDWGLLYLFIPIAAAVAVVVSCVKAIQWLVARRKRLLVSVSCHPYHLHPTVAPFLTERDETIKTAIKEFFERNPKDPPKGKLYDDRYEHAESLARDVKWKLDKDLPYSATGAAGLWIATVENNGEKKCIDVNLKLPNATFAIIRHDKAEEPVYLGKINEIVAIGELRPKGRCGVVAWTNTHVENWHLRQVHITHEAGSGRVTATWQIDRLGFVLGSLAKTGLGIVMVVIMVLGLFSLIVWAAVISSGPANQKAREQSRSPIASPSP
ncbi:MAG: hypothetical protein QOK24_1473 [Verrucomicrobiota bacterium]|jgi:hypothetical protein